MTIATNLSLESLRSLYFEGIFTRRDQVAHAEEGTNEWIWSHPEYRAWEETKSSILWIQGKPGSGKSVLAKSIQERLASLPGQDPLATQNMLFTRSSCSSVVSWFYHGRGGPVGISHESALKSILYQLLDQDRSLFQFYESTYRELRCPGTSHCRWSTDQLRAVLSRMAAAGDNGPQIVSVVDDMDESEGMPRHDRSREQILSLFSSLVNESRIKMIVLSRPARVIEREFRYCHHIVLEDENQNDIDRVVDAGLRSLVLLMQSFDSSDEETSPTNRRRNIRTTEVQPPRRPFMPPFLNRYFNRVRNSEEAELGFIKVYLLEHAQGVILWVTLIISELKRHVEKGMYTFKELRKELLGLPLRLENVYERIVDDLEQRHNEADRAKSRRILAWVIGASAKQPLQLKELLDALSIPSDLEAALKSDDDPIVANRPMIRSWNHFRRSLHELCGPLVEVIRPASVDREGDQDDIFEVGPSSVVQLLHQTVKDFLADYRTARRFLVQPYEAEWTVHRDGQRYLQLTLPFEPTKYTPLALTGGSGFEAHVEEVASYLEEKYLLCFVLKQHLADPYHDSFDGIPSHKSISAVLSAFMKQNPYNTRNALDTVDNVLVAQYFWLACGHGLVTAVENLLVVGSIVEGWWKHYGDAVLHGAFLAAVENGLFPMVKEMSETYCMHSHVFTDAVPLIDRAVRTGNEEITSYLFDAAFKTPDYYGIRSPRTPEERHECDRVDQSERAMWLATARNSSGSS